MPFLLARFQSECLWYHKHPPTSALSTPASFLFTDSCRRAGILCCKTKSNTSLHSDQMYCFRGCYFTGSLYEPLGDVPYTTKIPLGLHWFNCLLFSFYNLKHMLKVALIILFFSRLKQMQYHKCPQVMSLHFCPSPIHFKYLRWNKIRDNYGSPHTHTHTCKNKLTLFP